MVCTGSETENETKESNTHPPFTPDGEHLKKCNLSFSFNFDWEDVNSDASSDSESTNLQIDVSEVDNYDPSNWRKRESIEEVPSVLDEMEEEIERQLDAKAAKTNLTATNVKNILKHVITNEHVMAMVQKRLYKDDDKEDDIVFEPKLTRAKAKELAAAQLNIPWPITPMKKPTSEVQALIEEELPEDSSDEEYNPEQDKQSDDEREMENFTHCDLESQSVVKSNTSDLVVSDRPKSPGVEYDPEGVFKIPEAPHPPMEEDSIGQRTRSKLCLSETSLEQIEQAFVPPDITTDMYDWDGEVDEDWDNFLKEFTQPLAQDTVAEDDPEADPEYNILDDEETELLDKEELRADKAVKITRKELNNLIAELFEFTDSFSKQQQETSRKKKAAECTLVSTENSTLNCLAADLPVSAEPELPKLINYEQRQLLAIQLCQHVQLMAQHFVMTYMRPRLHSQSETCKQNLNSLKYLSSGPNSAFNAENLSHALKFISDWEGRLSNGKFHDNYIAWVSEEEFIKIKFNSQRYMHTPKFHPELQKLFIESKALLYPQLLPHVLFRSDLRTCSRFPYFKSEESLIALGLEQFLPFVSSKPRKFKGKKILMIDTAQLVSQYLLPCREPRGILWHIQKCRRAKDWNPIKHYFEKGSAPKTIHYIKPQIESKAPKDQPLELLPLQWQNYLIHGDVVLESSSRECILNSYKNLRKSCPIVPKRHPLRNPIINVMSKIIPKRNSPRRIRHNINPTPESVPPSQNTNEGTGTLSLPALCESSVDLPPNQKSSPNPGTSDTTDTSCASQSFEQGTSKDNWKKNKSEKQSESNPTDAKEATNFTEKSESPQLRRTTPRLAKTKSAQNMKLMAQVLGPKGVSSSCSSLKSRDKLEQSLPKTSVLPKVDDEDEIAELMLASTTIKRDAVSRKKAKEARELENIKRLVESENASSEEERESKFAASYFQKLHLTLEPQDAETFKSVIKLYAECNEKLESINKSESECSFSEKTNKDALVIDLYQNVCDKLRVYPELCSDFLLFLSPHQAAMIDKSVEYTMLKKMRRFINVAQVYFAKQPSRLAKMMQAITQLASDSRTTLDSVLAVMAPILKGHPLIMDLFLQVLPTAKPPESLFGSHLFENLVCPLGPHEKKTYAEDAPELYESIDLPVSTTQDDPYGGENCKCHCHNPEETASKTPIEHCVSCGMRYLNGRIYLQTSEGLRPAKVIFPGADEEKLENIARVSLKTTDKFVAPTIPKRRRRSSKNESSHDDLCQKSVPQKNSPTKENDTAEKAVSKSKKNVKVSLKSTEEKKSMKRPLNVDEDTSGSKRIRTSHQKSRRERRIENFDDKQECSSSESSRNMENYLTNVTENKHSESEVEEGLDHSEVSSEKQHKCIENVVKPSDSKRTEKTSEECNVLNNNPWSRQEDMILLQAIKEEYSEESLTKVSETLGDRTIEQVKDRCKILLSLLEKML